MSKRAKKIVKLARKRKAQKTQSPLTVVALPEQFDACFRHDVVMGSLSKWLTERDLIHFLRCNKRLYAFALPHWHILRECQRLYGGDHRSTASWVKHCVAAAVGTTTPIVAITALQWIFTRALSEYLEIMPRWSGDKRSEALIACISTALRTAFKTGAEDVIELILSWRSTYLAPHMTEHDCLYALLNQIRTANGLLNLFHDHMKIAAHKGHTGMVRRFFERHCPDFSLPVSLDVRHQGDKALSADKVAMSESDQIDLIDELIMACILHGDTVNYAYFDQVRSDSKISRTSRYLYTSRAFQMEAFKRLLAEGVSTTFIPILFPYIYPGTREWEEPHLWIMYACRNPNPVMLDYVRTRFSDAVLVGCVHRLKLDYANKEFTLREKCAALMCEPMNKKLMNAIALIRARLCYLKRILISSPFLVEWSAFRSYAHRSDGFLFTLNW